MMIETNEETHRVIDKGAKGEYRLLCLYIKLLIQSGNKFPLSPAELARVLREKFNVYFSIQLISDYYSLPTLDEEIEDAILQSRNLGNMY
jgi:hypothetical protein